MQSEMQKWKFYSYFQVPKVGLLQNYKEAMVYLSPRNGYEPYIIQDKIHVRLPTSDLGKSSQWPLGHWAQMEFYEKIDVDGSYRP